MPAIHTVPTANGWSNRHTGKPELIDFHLTQMSAVVAGRKLAVAYGVEHVVHDENDALVLNF